MFNFFTSLLTAIISDRFRFTKELDQITTIINVEYAGVTDFVNNRLNTYSYFSKYYNELNPTNDGSKLSKEKLTELICDSKDGNYVIVNETNIKNIRTVCKNVIDSKYILLEQGYDAAIKALYQNILNLYNDYKNIPSAYLMTKENITKYFNKTELWQLDLNLNFVVNLMQDVIYNLFARDQKKFKDDFKNRVSVFNSCAIAYSVFSGFFIIVFILYPLKQKSLVVERSTNRMNRAFLFIRENNLGGC